ncbi:MAG: hypothetical protein JSV78_07935 [Phycisphaerales bacterium]|nr:MAG: hypothetical protein JSV78_07935 [Phycisphaerales bacterium]
MKRRMDRALKFFASAGLCIAGGCAVDPDILLNAQLTFLSDLAVFLLQNAVAGAT